MYHDITMAIPLHALEAFPLEPQQFIGDVLTGALSSWSGGEEACPNSPRLW